MKSLMLVLLIGLVLSSTQSYRDFLANQKRNLQDTFQRCKIKNDGTEEDSFRDCDISASEVDGTKTQSLVFYDCEEGDTNCSEIEDRDFDLHFNLHCSCDLG